MAHRLSQRLPSRLSPRRLLLLCAAALSLWCLCFWSSSPPLPAKDPAPGVVNTFQSSTPGDGRIVVLYQISTDGNWQNIVNDQLTKLVYSGLYAEVSLFYCTAYGSSPVSASLAEEYLQGYGNKFTVVGSREPPTASQSLASIRNLTASDRILYLSTHGTTVSEGTPAAEIAFHWRTEMEYQLIKDYRRCLLLLRQTDVISAPSYLSNNASDYLPYQLLRLLPSSTSLAAPCSRSCAI